MPNYLPLRPDAKFSYKGWIVSIEQIFNFKIYFSIDVIGITLAISKALKEHGLENDSSVRSLLDSVAKEGSHLILTYEKSITVFHTFNWVNKCKDDAVNYIDNVLGDGMSYAKNNNLIPSLKYFI